KLLPPPASPELEPGAQKASQLAALEAPLFKNAPFAAPDNQSLPGFANPLGIASDKNLKVFSGVVQFMDLLGDFTLEQDKDQIASALPPNALKGLDYRDDLLEGIFQGKRRAFDPSLLEVSRSKVRELDGRPVTEETSPLSLAGYGSVNEYVKPVREHWTRCSSVEKRVRVMERVPRQLRKKYKPRPSTCFPI
ncbi:MAG: hypothetical protein AB8C02_17710, partial [Halioglobus sp.]